MTGWDQPDVPQFRRDLAAFEKTPFDGVILFVPGKKPDGTSFTSFNNLFSREPWTEAMFAESVADLKAARSTNESRDPAAKTDLEAFMERLALEGQPWLRHALEGADELPIRSTRAMLTTASLEVPVDSQAPQPVCLAGELSV